MTENIELVRLANLSAAEFEHEFLDPALWERAPDSASQAIADIKHAEVLLRKEPRKSMEEKDQAEDAWTSGLKLNPWDIPLLEETVKLVRALALSRKVLYSSPEWTAMVDADDVFQDNEGGIPEVYEDGLQRAKENLVDLVNLREEERQKRKKAFRKAGAAVTREDSQENGAEDSPSVDRFPKTEAEKAGRLAVVGEALFKTMRELKRNRLLSMLEKVQKTAFPVFDFSRFGWHSEFVIVALAQAHDEKARLSAIAGEADVIKRQTTERLAYLNEEQKEEAKDCETDWTYLARIHPPKRFADILIHSDEIRDRGYIKRHWGYLPAAQALQVLVLWVRQIDTYGHSIGIPTFGGPGVDATLKKLLAAPNSGEAELSPLEKWNLADDALEKFEESLSKITLCGVLDGTCPKTMKRLRRVAAREINTFKAKLEPMATQQERDEALKGDACQLVKAQARLCEAEEAEAKAERKWAQRAKLREEYRDDIERAAATLHSDEFGEYLLATGDVDPEDLDTERISGNLRYKAGCKSIQARILIRILCSDPERHKDITIDIEEFSREKDNLTFENLRKLMDLANAGKVPDEEQKKLYVKQAANSMYNQMKNFNSLCPQTAKSIRSRLTLRFYPQKDHLVYG